jgi:hypothetical protein
MQLGVIASLFIGVIFFGINGGFRPAAKLPEASAISRQKSHSETATPAVDADFERRKKEDDKTTLFVTSSQILNCFDPIDRQKRLRFTLVAEELPGVRPGDGEYNDELRLSLYLYRNSLSNISAVELRFKARADDSKSPGEMLRLSRIGTAWQQVCSTIDTAFDGRASAMYIECVEKSAGTASTANKTFKLEGRGTFDAGSQEAEYVLRASRAGVE